MDALVSNDELVEKYGKYCGYWARHFLYKEIHRQDHQNMPPSESRQAAQAEAEDLAQMALIKLIKCPQAKRREHNYVVRTIINGVLDGIRDRRKILANEWQPPRTVGVGGRRAGHSEDFGQGVEYFDSLPGRDGLAGNTQAKCDLAKVQARLEVLPSTERIVLQLHFGLTGLRPASVGQIGRKLGRTEFWVERRLSAGMRHVREELGVTV